MEWFALGFCLLVIYLVSTRVPLRAVAIAAVACGGASLLIGDDAGAYSTMTRSILNCVVLACVVVLLIRVRGSSQFQRSRGYRIGASRSLGRGAGEGSDGS